MDLKELILRGRFILAGSPERLRLFESVNGKRTAQHLAKSTRRHVNNVRRDLNLLCDAGLIEFVLKDGKPMKVGGYPLYDKVPLARAVPTRYFQGPTASPIHQTSGSPQSSSRSSGMKTRKPLPLPDEQQILDIAKNGENQIYEFKGQGTDIRKITREVAAFLNTSEGGQIFYGIDDDGNLEGSDLTSSKLDQPLQNSVRNSISPSTTIRISTVSVMGTPIIAITVPPWNARQVYMFDEKVLVRKGTNVFAARPDELKQLHSGKPIV